MLLLIRSDDNVVVQTEVGTERKLSKRTRRMDERTVALMSEADRVVYIKLLDGAERDSATSTTTAPNALKDVPKER